MDARNALKLPTAHEPRTRQLGFIVDRLSARGLDWEDSSRLDRVRWFNSGMQSASFGRALLLFRQIVRAVPIWRPDG